MDNEEFRNYLNVMKVNTSIRMDPTPMKKE